MPLDAGRPADPKKCTLEVTKCEYVTAKMMPVTCGAP